MGNYCKQTIQHKQEFPVHMWSACLGALFAYFPVHWFNSTKFGCSTIDGCNCFDNQSCQQEGETSTTLSSTTEGKNPMPAFWCHVNGCGELGYHKSAKVFSANNYFQAIRESFHLQKKPAIRYYMHYWVARMWLGQLSIWLWNNPFHTFSLPHSVPVVSVYIQLLGMVLTNLTNQIMDVIHNRLV